MEKVDECRHLSLGTLRGTPEMSPHHDDSDPNPPHGSDHSPRGDPPHGGPPHERSRPDEGPNPSDPDDPPASDDRYLYVVSYGDDAERKRAEYLFDTWEEGEIRNPDGLVRVAAGVDHEELYRRLLVKFRADQVDAYELSELDPPATPETRTVERTVAAPSDAVRSFLHYLLSKKKGEETGEGWFEVYTNKGRADVAFDLDESGGETTVAVTVEGHPPALDHLEAYLRRELDAFADGQ